jgi:group II intron reverse transcriptase/maturase
MSDAERVRLFQRKLYLKAKQEERYCFYVLYDKVRSMRFLREAYRRVRSNRGKPGVDGVSFDDIEREGVEGFLAAISAELEAETYRPSMVLRVMIPKPNGKQRPLGIPTIKDRVVQMACKLVIEPIFEADFDDSSYGFRPKRSAQGAVKQIKELLKRGYTEVYDADLSEYFDSIPHEKLLLLVAQRISDRKVLGLIRMWLKAPVFENGRPRGGKKSKVGTPQGGVISPLLANIYLHLLDRAVARADGMFARFGVKIVRYADDFVLMGTHIPAETRRYLEALLARMGLKLNVSKSRMVDARRESLDFLGFTFRNDHGVIDWRTRYWNVFPSVKSQSRLRGKIRGHFRANRHMNTREFIRELNVLVRGWMNYYHVKGVSYVRPSSERLRHYLSGKLRNHFLRMSQRGSKLYRRYGFHGLVHKFGLIDPVRQYMLMKSANA